MYDHTIHIHTLKRNTHIHFLLNREEPITSYGMLSESRPDSSVTVNVNSTPHQLGDCGDGDRPTPKVSNIQPTSTMASQQEQEAAPTALSIPGESTATTSVPGANADAPVGIGVDFHRDNTIGICDNWYVTKNTRCLCVISSLIVSSHPPSAPPGAVAPSRA